MLASSKRKSIAKSFISEFFCGARPELWQNYKCSDEHGYAKSWCPLPCPWIHSAKSEPIIGVAETKKEAMTIVKSELPEDRWDAVEYNEYEYVDGKKYWVIVD